eukprot:tig00021116_g18414.t1
MAARGSMIKPYLEPGRMAKTGAPDPAIVAKYPANFKSTHEKLTCGDAPCLLFLGSIKAKRYCNVCGIDQLAGSTVYLSDHCSGSMDVCMKCYEEEARTGRATTVEGAKPQIHAPPAPKPAAPAPPPAPVLVPAPAPAAPASAPASHDYSTGLCDCLSDTESCLITCFVPCFQIGWTAEKLDGSSCVDAALKSCVATCLCGNAGLFFCGFDWRQKIRKTYSLGEDRTMDCLKMWCCTCCAIAQDAREVKKRTTPVGKNPMAAPASPPAFNKPPPAAFGASPSAHGAGGHGHFTAIDVHVEHDQQAAPAGKFNQM